MSSNNIGHLITSTIITLQHFATLHQTTLHYTFRHFTPSHLHFTTLSLGLTHLHFLPFYFTHITKLDTVQFSHPSTYFQNNEPLHCPKESLTISLHITFYLFIHLSYQPFTSLYFAIHIYDSLPFISLPFTFRFLSPSLPPLFYTFLTLVLKICVLPSEVPIAPSGSWYNVL